MFLTFSMIYQNKILIIQNDPADPPGVITKWFQNFDLIHSYKEKIPSFSNYSLVVICGGDPNVHEETIYPWLVDLKKELKHSIYNSKTKFVGLCLGGQLCAEALGAKVYAHPNGKKVGWTSVSLDHGKNDAMFFRYHSYVFDLPQSAHRMAFNECWENQGFLWKNQILAVQFHPEAEEAWILGCLETQTMNEEQRQWMNAAHDWLKHEIDCLLKS